uniref:Takeout like n=1 Tax=Argyresthia conjugella TaxID=687015 RepID=H9N4S6_9NEOP|nr:takeout like [Argyresthia conjugella]
MGLVGTLASFAFLQCVTSIALPEYITQCKRSDPNLNSCALQSAKDSLHRFSLGDKSRGLGPLDPLYVPEMTVYVPNQNGIKVAFLDNYFSGLSNLKLDDLRFDLNKKMITADGMVSLDVKGRYELSGKILVVPVRSNGDSTIVLKNTDLHIKFWYEHVQGDDGKVHWKIFKHDIKYEVEKATFKLDNLLNDKAIGDQINRLLNEMWKEIITEVGPSIAKSLIGAVVQNVGALLEQVSYDELMPE